MSNLIICLPPLLSGVAPGVGDTYDYVVSGDGRVASSQASAPAAGLPVVVRGGETVAVVPVAMLSWHQVTVPKGVSMGSPRVRVVLESLLEDRLLDSVDQVHLALPPSAAAGVSICIAVCDKQWLHAHLQTLEAAGRPVGRIVPEFSPDVGPLLLHIFGDHERPCVVATGSAVTGVQCLPFVSGAMDLVPLPLSVSSSVLPAKRVSVFSSIFSSAFAAPDETHEEDLLVFAEPVHVALAEEVLQRKVALLTRSQRWLDAARSSWDLAQFDLVSSGRTRTVKRLSGAGREFWQSSAWKPVRWGLALLLGVNLVGLNAWAWKEQSVLRRQRADVQATLTQTFPQVKLVVDAPVQMEREVAALRQATGVTSGRDLEAMLGALAAALPPSHSADGIEFTAGEARFKGLKLQGPDTSALTSQLKSAGYTARLESDVLSLRSATTLP